MHEINWKNVIIAGVLGIILPYIFIIYKGLFPKI